MPRYIICLCFHALKLHERLIFLTSSIPCHLFCDFVTFSLTLSLLSAFQLCLFASLAVLDVCLSFCQADDGRDLHGSALFHVDCPWPCLCWRCRGASIKLSVSTSADEADFRTRMFTLSLACLFTNAPLFADYIEKAVK